MSFGELVLLSHGWPVLLSEGMLLGGITLCSQGWRAHLLWYLPALLLAAVAFPMVTGAADNALILAPERLGIGVLVLLPAVVLSFVIAWCLLRAKAKDWLLFGAPVAICLLCTPLAGYLARLTVCELTGDCP